MIVIKVVWGSSGNPVEGSRVNVSTGSGVSSDVFTNENGIVRFHDFEPGDRTWVYVDGDEVFSGYIPERTLFKI